MKDADYIVVGGGIAGTVLCLGLKRAGKSVIWITNDLLSSSSSVAAGIMNPLVFRYLTEVWKVAELLPYAIQFYTQFDKENHSACFNEITIAKVFGEQDAALWRRKAAHQNFSRWITEVDGSVAGKEVKQPFGAGLVKAAWLDTAKFLQLAKYAIGESVSCLSETFDFQQLRIEQSSVCYQNMMAEKIIFCEGHLATKNPFFNFVPFRPVKGELLDVRLKGFHGSELINKDIFMLPVENEVFRIGSTYDWSDLTEKTTLNGQQYLLAKLQQIVDLPVEIVAHKAGIRPAVADRRPVVGLHPVYPQLAILNGLGARGVMLAPYFGAYLVEVLLSRAQIDAEVDPKRFESFLN